MGTEITLVQTPIIKHDLTSIGAEVTNRIKELNLENLVATEDTVKSLKTLRAELNKEFENYEAQRKAIKEAVANPYIEFENVYKAEIQEKYKKAVELLKDKIAAVEDRIKADKKTNIIRYFNELCAVENIDFLKFENVGLEINLSTTEKAYKEKCNDFVKRVQDDVILINTMDHAAEMMAEYKINGFNASVAIKSVRDRKQAEKLELERIKQKETIRRSSMLRELNFFKKDLTNCFHFVSDENIFISQSDVENLTIEDFLRKYAEIESKVNAFKQSQQQTLFDQKPSSDSAQQPVAPDPVSTPEPLQAPIEVKPAETEKKFKANFEVNATMAQLNSLSAFLKAENISYSNLTDDECKVLDRFRKGTLQL